MSFNLTIQDYPHYTYKDYKRWEGDWELIRGIPYAMSPSPNWQHQDFGALFIQRMKNALQQTPCQCRVLYESDWVISEDTVVRPDVMVVCEEIKGNHVTQPPSLILEILSPSSILIDRNTKFNLYQAYGVRYYLIADLGKKLVEIFQLKNNSFEQIENRTEFLFNKDCSVSISVQDLFD